MHAEFPDVLTCCLLSLSVLDFQQLFVRDRECTHDCVYVSLGLLEALILWLLAPQTDDRDNVSAVTKSFPDTCDTEAYEPHSEPFNLNSWSHFIQCFLSQKLYERFMISI